MYQLDSEHLANAIRRAYTDTGMMNEYLMQQYLNQLQQGVLKKILPSVLKDYTVDGTNRFFHTYEDYSETTGLNPNSHTYDEAISSEALNQKNERDKRSFDKQAYKFLYTLRHTVFEDGMDNEAIAMFSDMMERNKFVSITWLQEFWAEHQDESPVVEGIIRIIGRIDDKAYWKPLMSIVRSGLTDKSKPVQEASIMVVESWRTVACYQALKQTQFAKGWIKDYALEVMLELEEELQDEIHQED